MNSFKLFALLIVLNIAVGIGDAVWKNQGEFADENVPNYTSTFEIYESDWRSDEMEANGLLNPELQEQQLYGNPVKMGSMIRKMFLEGFRISPITTASDPVENIMLTSVKWLRYILLGLLALNFIMLILPGGKKT